MSHRTQITLEDAQYALLRAESVRTGLGLAELVRRALDATYGTTPTVIEAKLRIDTAFGLWIERGEELDGLSTSLRPGLGRKLETL